MRGDTRGERPARQAKPKCHLAGVAFRASPVRLDTLELVDSAERCLPWANEFSRLNIRLPGEVAV